MDENAEAKLICSAAEKSWVGGKLDCCFLTALLLLLLLSIL